MLVILNCVLLSFYVSFSLGKLDSFMKLGAELKTLKQDLAESITEIKEVIAGLKRTQAVSTSDDEENRDRYGIRTNARALAEKVVMVS